MIPEETRELLRGNYGPLHNPIADDLRTLEEKTGRIKDGSASEEDYRQAAELVEGMQGLGGDNRRLEHHAEVCARGILFDAIKEQEKYSLEEVNHEAEQAFEESEEDGETPKEAYIEGYVEAAVHSELEKNASSFIEELISEDEVLN